MTINKKAVQTKLSHAMTTRKSLQKKLKKGITHEKMSLTSLIIVCLDIEDVCQELLKRL